MGRESLTMQTESPLELGDPYRYQCPECDTHFGQLRRRVGSNAETTKWGERDDPDALYYCPCCRTPLRELYDKKRGEAVHVGTCERPAVN